MIITIDGPAGTGKSTVAKKVAEKLGLAFFDTGAMYRALTYLVLEQGIDLKDETTLCELLKNFSYEIQSIQGRLHYYVGSRDITDAIRTPEVTKKVSEVSANGLVRQSIVAIQRRFGKDGRAVFEGRDMGSIVFPKAQLKVFLTARAAVRAERRYNELKTKFASITKEEILKEIEERDEYDSTREISPLIQPKDAHLIDTSDFSIEEVVDRIVTMAGGR